MELAGDLGLRPVPVGFEEFSFSKSVSKASSAKPLNMK
jgi:hypothetical protein